MEEGNIRYEGMTEVNAKLDVAKVCGSVRKFTTKGFEEYLKDNSQAIEYIGKLKNISKDLVVEVLDNGVEQAFLDRFHKKATDEKDTKLIAEIVEVFKKFASI